MGIFEKTKITLSRFISSRNNVTILQCLLYGMMGVILGNVGLSWQEILFICVLMIGIQFITRIKAVADGMVMNQLMNDHSMQANDIIQRMKEEADKIKQEDDVDQWN